MLKHHAESRTITPSKAGADSSADDWIKKPVKPYRPIISKDITLSGFQKDEAMSFFHPSVEAAQKKLLRYYDEMRKQRNYILSTAYHPGHRLDFFHDNYSESAFSMLRGS
ncbi:hypothetical protein BT69DRAFT_1327803 [Atractiella rhizophila]|nr:hypothetical protein BT69DRAFT_1327803 [Atractiella rhizophila]